MHGRDAYMPQPCEQLADRARSSAVVDRAAMRLCVIEHAIHQDVRDTRLGEVAGEC